MDRDLIRGLIIGAFTLSTLILILAYIGYLVDTARCTAMGQAMQIESRYTGLTGCMVKVNEMWWPLKSLSI